MQDTIYNLPNDEYHKGDKYKEYLSSTELKSYMVSPKFARFKALHPEMFEIGVEAAEKGSLYHDAMESIVNTGSLDKWRNNLLVFEPPINPKTCSPYGRDTQKYQSALIEAKESNPGKTLTSNADVQLVETMVYELLNCCRETSKQIKQIMSFKQTKAEVSHFVEYKGCKFKYRPDVETAKKILDWKTVAVDDLHEDTVNKVISKFHYGISAAFYQFMEHERTGVWKEFYWVMQQKNAPYDAVFVSAANWAFHMEDGIVKMGPSALLFMKLLEQHVYCTQNNKYEGAQVFIQPGFKGRRIMIPDVPSFEKNRMFNFYNNENQ